MHRLVFEDGERRLGAIEERVTRLLDVRGRERLDDLTIRFRGKLLDDGALGPGRSGRM